MANLQKIKKIVKKARSFYGVECDGFNYVSEPITHQFESVLRHLSEKCSCGESISSQKPDFCEGCIKKSGAYFLAAETTAEDFNNRQIYEVFTETDTQDYTAFWARKDGKIIVEQYREIYEKEFDRSTGKEKRDNYKVVDYVATISAENLRLATIIADDIRKGDMSYEEAISAIKNK